MRGGQKKCILGLDNDGVFTPVTFLLNDWIKEKMRNIFSNHSDTITPLVKKYGKRMPKIEKEKIKNEIKEINEDEFEILLNISDRLNSIYRKIAPIIKLKGDIGVDILFDAINNPDRNYMTDYYELQKYLNDNGYDISIISKVGYKQGSKTIPEFTMNHKDKFKQLILTPCNDLDIDMLKKRIKESEIITSLSYWFYKSLADIRTDINTENEANKKNKEKNIETLELYTNGLEKLKKHYGENDNISFEKASYNEYNDESSGKFVDWALDKGYGIEYFLEGDRVYFVDDDIKNLRIVRDHFKDKEKKVIMFLMTHFIKSDDPFMLHEYDVSKKGTRDMVQYYHIDNFQQLREYIERNK